MEGSDLGKLRLADMRAGETAGERLERTHDLEHVFDVAVVQACNARAAIGQELDEPFGGQHLERLAQRRARDAETRAKLPLGDPCARRQCPLDDEVTQLADHGVVQVDAPAAIQTIARRRSQRLAITHGHAATAEARSSTRARCCAWRPAPSPI